MASKPNIRSIRFSDELAELIERQVGNSFTEKFENLITRCVWELPQKEAELKQVQERIQQERKRLADLQKRREKPGSEARLRQRLQTREARGREHGCGGRRRRISQRRSSSSSGPAADERGRRWRRRRTAGRCGGCFCRLSRSMPWRWRCASLP